MACAPRRRVFALLIEGRYDVRNDQETAATARRPESQ